ncbi:MAG: M23 family metallopeptidase [Rhodospirillales bacterium]|nr:M23 family metallopeptidase [Rhodospirillales bacterium]
MSKKLKLFFAFFAVFAICEVGILPGAGGAFAETLTINKPVTLANNSCFGLREGRPHKGSDYAGPIGYNISAPPTGYNTPPVYNPDSATAGKLVVFTYPGNTVVRYLHLNSYSAGPPPVMKLGNTGRSTGPHLHFEIILDGQPVDPEEAYDLNLNDPKIRSCLKEDGRKRLTGAIVRCQERRKCADGKPISNNPPPPVPPTDTNPVPMEDSPPPRAAGSNAVLYEESEYSLYGLESNACDTQVFTTMRARAALQAQEDTITSEIVIHKPDSVLEYTCADQFMGYTAENAGPLFSESTSWLGRKISFSVGGSTTFQLHMDSTSLDQVLEDAVVKTIDRYIDQQFPKKFLSDTSTLDTSVSGTIGGASYTCDLMKQVWQEAKCRNFGDTRVFTAGGGPFYDFTELVPNTSDPRRQYYSCQNTGLTSYDVDVAKNKDFNYHGHQAATLPGVNMHDYVNPENCTGLDPIATGIKMVTVENFSESTEKITEYEEHFCANPGCYYDMTDKKCKK